MSPDLFEDELRTLLRDATDAEAPAFDDVDPGVVLVDGRRVVRRRRTAMVGGTLAALLVVGGGAWAAFGGSEDRAAPVPATRTSMADVGVVEATVDLDGERYTVRLDTATGDASLAAGGGSGSPVGIGSVAATGRDTTWATVSRKPFVVGGVVPAQARSLVPRFTADTGGVASDTAPLRGTPYEAVVWRAEKSPQGASLASLDWSDGTHVWSDRGTEVPSAPFGDRLAFVDRSQDQLGVLEPDGSMTTSLSSYTDAGLPPLLATGTQTPSKKMVTTYVVLLPAGSTDVRADTDSRVTVTQPLRTADLPDGAGTLAMLEWTGPDDIPFTGVSQVSWRDGSGSHRFADGGSVDVPGHDGRQLGVTGLADDGRTTVVLQPPAERDGTDAAPVRVAATDLPAGGKALDCLPYADVVCAVVPAEPTQVEVVNAAGGRYRGTGFETMPVAGTGAHVLLAVTHDGTPGGVRWTDAEGRQHVAMLR